MATIGTIPENITYVSHGERTVHRGWDDFDEGPKHQTKVIPAFISDAANKKTLETGKRWATSQGYDYDYKTNKQTKRGTLKEETVTNSPMMGIKIINLEVRTQGGRAYKIVTPHNYYCDLREDVLLDTMLMTGIKNGVLEGEYIWARVGAQMKLIRIGSELHNELIVSTERSKMAKLSTKEFVPGGVYSAKLEKYIFIGWVNTTSFKCKTDYRGAYGTTPQYQFSMSKTNKAGLWCRTTDYGKDKGNYLKQLNKELKDKDNSGLYSFQIKNSNAIIEHVDTIEVDTTTIVNQIKNMAIQNMRKHMTGKGLNAFAGIEYAHPDLACMNLYGEPESVPDDLQPLIEHIEKNPPPKKEKKK